MQTNAPTTSKSNLSPYAELIHEATKAPLDVLDILEEIMRNEIFRSTLDWQTKKQFHAGAKKAYKIYLSNIPFYQADKRVRRSMSAKFRAEVDFKKFEGLPDSPEKHAALAQLKALSKEEEKAIENLQSVF